MTHLLICLQMASMSASTRNISISIWRIKTISHAQIIQTLKFRYAQYMGNQFIYMFWPTLYSTPFCELYPQGTTNVYTWSHMLGLCNHFVTHDQGVSFIYKMLMTNPHTQSWWNLVYARCPYTSHSTHPMRTLLSSI